MPTHLALAADSMVDVLVDRITVQAERRARLLDSIEQAMRFGQGLSIVRPSGQAVLKFSQHLHCPTCNITYRDPVPNLFSFNSPLGACETCRGFGRSIDIDLDLIIPDPRKSLTTGRSSPGVRPQPGVNGGRCWIAVHSMTSPLTSLMLS